MIGIVNRNDDAAVGVIASNPVIALIARGQTGGGPDAMAPWSAVLRVVD